MAERPWIPVALIFSVLLAGAVAYAEERPPLSTEAEVHPVRAECGTDPYMFLFQDSYNYGKRWRVFAMENAHSDESCKIHVWFDIYRDSKLWNHAEAKITNGPPVRVWMDLKSSRPKIFLRRAEFE